jgi:prepilin-type N-terminal cleavage/methylation domain-containing protein
MKSFRGFTTTSEAQHESQFSCLPSAGGVKAHRAFTLIETMVAVTILTLAIAGPLFTASRAIVAAQNARDQLTASYLAQEGIEYVRMMRDDAYLNSYNIHRNDGVNVSVAAWTDFLTSVTQCNATTNPTHACTLDLSGLSSQFCLFRSTCTPLYLVNGVYTQQSDGSVQKHFTRTIQVIAVSASDERIVSTVIWSFHNIPYTVMVTDHLTPWQ